MSWLAKMAMEHHVNGITAGIVSAILGTPHGIVNGSITKRQWIRLFADVFMGFAAIVAVYGGIQGWWTTQEHQKFTVEGLSTSQHTQDSQIAAMRLMIEAIENQVSVNGKRLEVLERLQVLMEQRNLELEKAVAVISKTGDMGQRHIDSIERDLKDLTAKQASTESLLNNIAASWHPH